MEEREGIGKNSQVLQMLSRDRWYSSQGVMGSPII